MMHKGQEIERKIERLKRELTTPIEHERRQKIQAAIQELRQQKREWERPH